jgi:hypothetical protein
LPQSRKKGSRGRDGVKVDPLSRRAIKFNCDKWGDHGYARIYHQYLSKQRYKSVRLLEIGVGGYGSLYRGGASMRMWASYFPRGKIIGVDINPKKLDLPGNVIVVCADQSDRSAMNAIASAWGPFDVIIDDGAHTFEKTIVSFQVLFPALKDGGFYAIEDVQTSFRREFNGVAAADAPTAINYFLGLASDLNYAERYGQRKRPSYIAADHATAVTFFNNMIMVTKGVNTTPSNFNKGEFIPNVLASVDELSVDPELRPYLEQRRCRYCFEGGQYDQAIEWFNKLPRAEEDIELCRIYAHSHVQTGRLHDIHAFVSRMIDRYPGDPEWKSLLKRITDARS